MKKLFTNLKVFMTLLLLCGVCSAWGETATLSSVSTKNVAGTGVASVSLNFGNVTCTVERTGGANNPGFYTSSGIVRYYKNDKMTLSVPSGYIITKVEFAMESGVVGVGTASPTGLSSDNKTWTGNSESVSFIAGATVRIKSITVTYAAQKNVSGIAVKTPPSKTAYYVGEDFDPAGLVITATYDDENTEDIAYTEANKDKFSFSGFNSEAVATNQEITVTYGEKSATFNVDVDAARTLNSIEVATNPIKMVYEVGESLDLAGLVVNGIFSKGDPEAVEYISDPAAGTTLNVVGTTTVTLTSVDNPGLSTSFNVTVKAIEGDRLTLAETGVSGSSYSAWGTSYTAPSGAVYTGLSAGSNSSIQLRSDATKDKPASGIISTTSGGFIKKVKVAWESHTAADRELEVFGSNVAYASVADLVDNVKKGTSLGTIKNGTSTELVIDGNYAYVGVRSKSGAMYLSSITFVWGTQATVEISPAGWATACLPFNVTVTGADAYYVTVEGGNLTKAEARVIPAGAGVLLKGVKDETTTATFTISADAPDTDDNMMIGSLAGETFSGGATYYILSTGAKGVGFYWDAITEDEGATAKCAAGKAVLAVPTTAGIKSSFSLDDETTSIHNSQFTIHNSENVMYNLNGQVVGKDYKGIVIVNGKKMLNK